MAAVIWESMTLKRKWLSNGHRGGPKSAPYGISIAQGKIWYSEAGVMPNTLVSFDPKTQKFQSWEIPSGGKVVRNMVTTSKGNLVLACSGVNGLALIRLTVPAS